MPLGNSLLVVKTHRTFATHDRWIQDDRRGCPGSSTGHGRWSSVVGVAIVCPAAVLLVLVGALCLAYHWPRAAPWPRRCTARGVWRVVPHDQFHPSVCHPLKSAQNYFFLQKHTQTAHRVAYKAPVTSKTHQGAWSGVAVLWGLAKNAKSREQRKRRRRGRQRQRGRLAPTGADRRRQPEATNHDTQTPRTRPQWMIHNQVR